MVESLPAMQQTLLQSYRKSLDEQKSCVKHNQTICNMIVKDIENLFDNTSTVNTVSSFSSMFVFLFLLSTPEEF